MWINFITWLGEMEARLTTELLYFIIINKYNAGQCNKNGHFVLSNMRDFLI